MKIAPLSVVALGLLAGVLASSSAGQTTTPTTPTTPVRILFPSKCQNGVFQPKSVVVTCADAGVIVKNIQWSQWTNQMGVGTGKAGRYPAKLILTAAKTCSDNALHYTKLRLIYPDARPKGFKSSTSYPFPCSEQTAP